MQVGGGKRDVHRIPSFTVATPRGLCAAAVFVLAAVPGCQGSGQRASLGDPAALQAAVDHLLLESAAAWNGGDLEGFVAWYKRGPETTFLSSTGLTHGWDADATPDSVTATGVFTLVVEKTPEGWRIVHDQSS